MSFDWVEVPIQGVVYLLSDYIIVYIDMETI